MPSPFRFLRAGPPPPNVVLVPDVLFFTRSVPITAGATAAEAASQVELALEALAPFPLAQLYYGWFWAPGAETAFVFAAYRRRFTTDQVAQWDGAELVLPAFAATLQAEDLKPATTILIHSPEGVTAVHWDAPPVPSKVLFEPLPPEATEEQRAAARDALLRRFAGSTTVVELPAPPTADGTKTDGEVVFRAGDFVSRMPAGVVAGLDVRDKGELAALRGARRRDVMLWRLTLGAAAAIILLGLGELALMGGGAWLGVRERLYRVRKPMVDRIEQTDTLAHRIEELRTKRLLPLEMVTELVGKDLERKPEDILFTSVQTSQTLGLHKIVIVGRTTNPAQVTAYETALRNLPSCESVNAQFSGLQDQRASFTLTVTFKPEVLKPVGTTVVSQP